MRSVLPPALAAASLLVMAACGQSPAERADPPASLAEEAEAPPPAESAGPLFDVAALGIPTDADSIADGRAIAEMHCAACHGLDAEPTPRTDAPPLRHVLSLYAPDNLAEDFRAGIHVGHEDMPDFVFGDLGMDVLLAYLVSIQEAPPAQ